MKENEESRKIRVVYIKPGEKPEIREMEDTLEACQEAVGGWIEMFQPFDDGTTIICNEEGKANGMELNRLIEDNCGKVIDIIAGPFFICRVPDDSDRFESLTRAQAEKYMRKYRYPEYFTPTEHGILVNRIRPSKPKEKGRER